MKATVIKKEEKVVFCEKVSELTVEEFAKLKEESKKNLLDLENEKAHLIERLELCELKISKLESEIVKIYHQFDVDHGESEE